MAAQTALHTNQGRGTVQQSLARVRQRRAAGDESGFTLIELLIVIVILGILAAIVVFAVQNLSSTSAQASCKSDYKTVETGVEAYKAQMGNYPSGSAATAGATPNTDSDVGTSPYTTGTALSATLTTPAAAAVNAAGVTTASATGDELLTVGTGATKNTSGTATVGPWLKDVPANSGHYSLFVANDGSGRVLVLNSSGDIVSASGATSGTPALTAADCGGIN